MDTKMAFCFATFLAFTVLPSMLWARIVAKLGKRVGERLARSHILWSLPGIVLFMLLVIGGEIAIILTTMVAAVYAFGYRPF